MSNDTIRNVEDKLEELLARVAALEIRVAKLEQDARQQQGRS